MKQITYMYCETCRCFQDVKFYHLTEIQSKGGNICPKCKTENIIWGHPIEALTGQILTVDEMELL